jgi:hypothetical protein
MSNLEVPKTNQEKIATGTGVLDAPTQEHVSENPPPPGSALDQTIPIDDAPVDTPQEMTAEAMDGLNDGLNESALDINDELQTGQDTPGAMSAEIAERRRRMGLLEEEPENKKPPRTEPEEFEKQAVEFEEKTRGILDTLRRYGPTAAFDPGMPAAKVTQQLIGGTLATVQELGNFAIEALDGLENLAAQWGVGSGDLLDENSRVDIVDKIYPRSDQTSLQVARGVTQYLVPFAGVYSAAARGSSFAMGVTKGAVGASALSYAAIDPTEERLANLIQDVPALANPLTEWLSYDEGDSRVESRLKNAVESLVVDTLGVGVVLGGKQLGKTFMTSMDAVKKQRELLKNRKALETIEKTAGETIPDPQNMRAAKGKVEDLGPGETVQKQIKETRKFMNEYGELPKLSGAEFEKLADARTVDQARAALSELRIAHEGMSDEQILTQISRRWNITDKQRAKMAKKVLADVDKVEALQQRQPGQVFNQEEVDALRMTLAKSEMELLSFKIDPDTASPQELLQLQELWNGYLQTGANVKGVSAELGRGLRSLRQTFDDAATDTHRFKLIRELSEQGVGGEEGLRDLARMVKGIQEMDLNQAELAVGVGTKVWKFGKNVSNSLAEHVINGYLGSPVTWGRNVITSTAVAAWRVPEVAAAKAWGKASKHWGGKDHMANGEIAATARGFVDGISDGWRFANKAFRKGEMPQGVIDGTLVKAPPRGSQTTSAKAFGVDEGSTFGKMIDAYGRVVNIPLEAIRYGDLFNRGISYRTRASQLGARRAQELNLAPGTKEYDQFMESYWKNVPESIDISANNFATESVFAKQIDETMFMGNFFGKIQGAAKSLPVGIGRVAVPFTRALVGLVDYGVQRTPIMQHASPRFRMEMKAGGARRQEAIGKTVAASTLMLTGATAGYMGFYQGSLPTDHRSRRAVTRGDTGWQENSFILPNGQRISTGRVDPFASMFTIGADLATIFANMSDDEHEREWTEFAGATATILADYITPDFIGNTGDLLEAWNSVKNGEINAGSFERKFADIVATAAPLSGTMRFGRRLRDPQRRVTDPDDPDASALSRSFDRLKKEFLNRVPVPGWSEGLPPHRNIFGEAIHYPPGFAAVSPFEYTMATADDPVTLEIERLGLFDPTAFGPKDGETRMTLSMPSRVHQVIPGKQSLTVKYTPEEYDKFVQLSAGIGLKGAPGELKDVLAKEISAGYPSIPEGYRTDQNKRIYIKEVVSGYRKAAKAQLLQEFEDINARMNRQMDLMQQARTEE